MAARRINDPKSASTPSRRRPPATTPEARENQLGAMAYDLIEKRLADGSATAQETLFFAKTVSSRERSEQEKLRLDRELLQAKIEGLESAKRVEELYETALNAMREYSGQAPPEGVDD